MLDEESVTGAAQEEVPQEQETVEEVVEEQDPGQLEGMPQEQKNEHVPPPESPRFKEIYHKAKEGERQVATLTEQIEALKRQIEAPTQPPVSVQAPPEEKPAIVPDQSELKELKESLVNLKANRKQARREADDDKLDELEDKIDEVKDKMNKIKFNQSQTVNPTAITDAIQKEQVKSAAENFANTNVWFRQTNLDGTPNANYDYAMSGAAVTLEATMAKTWDGPYNDLLAEVSKRVEARFNPQKAERPLVAAIGGVSTVQKTNGKVISLSANEKKAAEVIFPNAVNPEQEYINLRKSQGAN